MNILITGGTGHLGRQLVDVLPKDYHIRIASRNPPPKSMNVEWRKMNLDTGEGMAEALSGADIVFHLASNTKKMRAQTDVEGTRKLVAEAKRQGVKHFIYISIVGIDRIPVTYYTYKLAAERLIAESGIPYTILRATQFHEFVEEFIKKASHLPIMLLPMKFKFQPIETRAVARHLLDIAGQPPVNATLNIGGKDVLTLGEMAREWKQVRGLSKWLINLPLPGVIGAVKAFYNGYNTCDEQSAYSMTWREYLRNE